MQHFVILVFVISSSDIDECYEYPDSCRYNENCTNTEGNFTCSCYFLETYDSGNDRCYAGKLIVTVLPSL